MEIAKITKLFYPDSIDDEFDSSVKNIKKSSFKYKVKSGKNVLIGKKVKILFVKDRPGHDVRYALNSNKIKYKLGWKPRTNFRQGIKLTFDWYFKNSTYYKSLSKKDIVKRLGRG